MHKSTFSEVVENIRRENSRFEKSAYYFVRYALDYTLTERQTKGKELIRHVSGRELLDGIRNYAIEQFGPMTITVFNAWNIRNCRDFGEIVFQLVDHGVFGKTENDKIEDFECGYDFEEAFVQPFLPERKRQALNKP